MSYLAASYPPYISGAGKRSHTKVLQVVGRSWSVQPMVMPACDISDSSSSKSDYSHR